ncbi:MAG: STAS domain-containing protein [Opitutae bacterium]|nr:STAS domain-containing protein [Opitutae bacterium]
MLPLSFQTSAAGVPGVAVPAVHAAGRIEGALTAATVEHWREWLAPRLQQGGDVQLDLSAVEACDFAGLQFLCSARIRALSIGRRLTLLHLSPAILTIARQYDFSAEDLSGELTPINRA